MDLEDEVKWRSVQSHARDILYYCNKVTGQQKWTNKNCFCSKPKDPSQPISPCCIKTNSTQQKLGGKAVVEKRNGKNRDCLHLPNTLSTMKVYRLSDIVREVQRSILVEKPKATIIPQDYRKQKYESIKNQRSVASKNGGTATVQKQASREHKIEDKVDPNKTILKRKLEVSDPVNGYKAKLRRRQDKRDKHIFTRKYTRRKRPVKSVDSAQTRVLDKDGNGPKKSKLAPEEKELEKGSNLTEEHTTGIDQVTVTSPSKNDCNDVKIPIVRNVGLESRTSEKSPNNSKEIADAGIVPQFVNESSIQMNEPVQIIPEIGTKESKNDNAIDKDSKDLICKPSKVMSSFKIPIKAIDTGKKNPNVSSDVVSKSTCSTPLKSFEQETKVVDEAISMQTKENDKVSDITSPQLRVSDDYLTNPCPQSYGKFKPNIIQAHEMNRCQPKTPLNKIVKSLKSKNKNAVPVKSTVSKTRWTTILSKKTRNLNKSKRYQEESILNMSQDDGGLESLINTESCSEDVSSDFGHTENVFTQSVESETIVGLPVSSANTSESGPDLEVSQIANLSENAPVREPEVPYEVGAEYSTTNAIYQTAEEGNVVSEIPASSVDLSWRIVTSNDGHSASLSNFFKLVPAIISKGSSRPDYKQPRSFLGVPVHGGPQVIAKILNTSMPQKCDEVFRITHKPSITTSGSCVKRMTLNFVWNKDAVLIQSTRKSQDLSREGPARPRLPIWIDLSNRVSIVLPKPLRLPEAGCVVYLGDFNANVKYVDFVVTHMVTVSRSPRPSLTLPSGTPFGSTSTICQTIRCRSPGEAKIDVETALTVPVVKESPKDDDQLFKKCTFCGAVLRCQKDIKLHRKMHTSLGGIKCSECKRRFLNAGRLSVHVDTHKCQWHYTCENCQKLFRRSKFLTSVDLAKDYYKMCLTCRRRELKCKKCTDRFMTFEELNDHVVASHCVICPICQESFLFKRDYNKHMKTSHEITSLPPSTAVKSITVSK